MTRVLMMLAGRTLWEKICRIILSLSFDAVSKLFFNDKEDIFNDNKNGRSLRL